jgi:uncharacterized membrane protein
MDEGGVLRREDKLVEEHSDRLASQHQLAIACQADEQIKKSVEMMEHIVAVKSVVYRKDQPSRLVSESALNYFLLRTWMILT